MKQRFSGSDTTKTSGEIASLQDLCQPGRVDVAFLFSRSRRVGGEPQDELRDESRGDFCRIGSTPASRAP